MGSPESSETTPHIYNSWDRAFRCNNGAQWWNQSHSISHFKQKSIEHYIWLSDESFSSVRYFIHVLFCLPLKWQKKFGPLEYSVICLLGYYVRLSLNHPSNTPPGSLYIMLYLWFALCSLTFLNLFFSSLFYLLELLLVLSGLVSPHRTTNNQEGENGGIKDQKKCSSCKRRRQTEDLCQFIS